MNKATLAAIAVAFAVIGFKATAQDDPARSYPNRPVRIVIGYSAGGGNDIITRIVAAKMAEGLGQSVVVENRPGAQSILAAEMVAKAPADGYTLLVGPSGPMTINPATYSKLPYAPLRDFVPLSLIGQFPLILGVSSNLPVRSVKELIEYARANPSRINYASSAGPFQMAAELFNQRTGTAFAHIPYKGSGDSVSATMTGEVTMTLSDPAPIAGPLKAGKVRGLAVTGASRHPNWPDLPTLTEAGIPDMVINIWTGLVAPAGTSPVIVKKLSDEIARVLKLPEVRERLVGLGVDPISTSSEEFGRIIAADIARWTTVARTANIKAD